MGEEPLAEIRRGLRARRPPGRSGELARREIDLRRRRRATAKRYATDPDGPYRYYYSQLYTKLKRGGRLDLFKTRRDQPDDEVTLDGICDKLVFYGSPNKVADQILAFREEVGDFGTLLLAGKDWKDRALGRRVMSLLAEKVMPQDQRRDREQVSSDLRALRAEGGCCDVIMTWTSHLDMSVSPHSFKLQLAVTAVDFVN